MIAKSNLPLLSLSFRSAPFAAKAFKKNKNQLLHTTHYCHFYTLKIHNMYLAIQQVSSQINQIIVHLFAKSEQVFHL